MYRHRYVPISSIVLYLEVNVNSVNRCLDLLFEFDLRLVKF